MKNDVFLVIAPVLLLQLLFFRFCISSNYERKPGMTLDVPSTFSGCFLQHQVQLITSSCSLSPRNRAAIRAYSPIRRRERRRCHRRANGHAAKNQTFNSCITSITANPAAAFFCHQHERRRTHRYHECFWICSSCGEKAQEGRRQSQTCGILHGRRVPTRLTPVLTGDPTQCQLWRKTDPKTSETFTARISSHT